jgi:hypothetical protein
VSLNTNTHGGEVGEETLDKAAQILHFLALLVHKYKYWLQKKKEHQEARRSLRPMKLMDCYASLNRHYTSLNRHYASLNKH